MPQFIILFAKDQTLMKCNAGPRILLPFVLLMAAATLQAAAQTPPQPAKATFPRLLGMNIGKKHYDDPQYQKQLARLDIVILGFYKGWKPKVGIASVVRNIKALSGGKCLVGQYTIMNEAYDNARNTSDQDIRSKLDQENWWVHNAAGNKVQWTKIYRAWDINFTALSKPDAAGQRWPEWLVARNDKLYFQTAPFDLWFCDNVMRQPRVKGDWDHDGKDDNPRDPAIAAAYRAGHQAEWAAIRKLHPGMPIMGNADGPLTEPEFAGGMEGAFLEGLMGKSWSIEKREGWAGVMKRYREALANTRAPHMVGFNVHGDPKDLRFFRYAYASCLLDDGYFCFSDLANGYSSVPWFDEYDFALGTARTPPPAKAWQNGVWRRDFERGVALVNPAAEPVTVTLEPGFRRLQGRQDAAVNSGEAVTTLTLPAKDGIILGKP